jgi:hypothetical protein
VEQDTPIMDADDDELLEDADDDLPSLDDAPDVEPIEVDPHEEGDRDP